MNKKILGWFVLGSLASSTLSFVSIPIIAWVFASADIGKVALLISVTGLGTIFFSLGLDQSFTREYHETSDHAMLLLNSVLPGLILFFMVAFVVLAVKPTWLSWMLFGENSFLLSLFVVWYLFVVIMSRFLCLCHRMSEDGKRYSLSFLFAKISFVILIGLIYYNSRQGLQELLFAHGVSVSVGLAYLLITTRSLWSHIRLSHIDWIFIRKLLAFGLPVATSGLLFWGLEGVDKLMLRSFSNFTALGVYSVALSISAMANVASTMFTTIWIPIVYRWIANKTDLSRIDQITQYILVGIIFLIGITGMFSWLLEYALPVQHHVVQFLITACMLWPLFYALSETTGLGIAVTRSSRLGFGVALVSLLANVVLNLLLLPKFGSEGAAVSLAISIWIFFVLRTEISSRIWRKVPRKMLYAWTTTALILSIVHALVGSQIRLFMQCGWFVFLLTACIIFREQISDLIIWTSNMLRRRSAKLT